MPKAQTPQALFADLQAIDPMGMVIITAAGIAGAAGISGPLTTLIDGVASGLGSTAKAVTQVTDVLTTPGWEYIAALFSGQSTPSLPTTSDQRSAMVKSVGLAASNMVEAGILYTLVRNPETMKAIFGMTQEAVKGAVGLGKAGAAILGA